MIDIENMTIGEARKLAALLAPLVGGGVTVQAATLVSAAVPGERHVGTIAVVRSRGSGVWIGHLAAAYWTPAGHSVDLTNARRLWSWTGAAECAQIARDGVTGGKISVPASPTVHEVLEVHEASAACVASLAKVPPWTA